MNLSKINLPRFNGSNGVPEMTETRWGYWVRYEDTLNLAISLRRKLLAAYAIAAASTFGFAIMLAVFIAYKR